MPRPIFSQLPWLLITSLLASLVLVGASVAGYLSARDLSDTLDKGQSEAIFLAVLNSIALEEDREGALNTVLEEQQALGLRALAVLEGDGAVLAMAGDPLTRFPCGDCGDSHRREQKYVGTRIRVTAPEPPPLRVGGTQRTTSLVHDEVPSINLSPRGIRSQQTEGRGHRPPPPPSYGGRFPEGGPEGGPDGLSDGPDWGPEGEPGGGLPPGLDGKFPPELEGDGPPARKEGAARRHRLLLEIEPVLSSGLRDRALGNLMASLVASALLTVSAGLAWRLQRRAEQERQRMEQERKLAALGQMSSVLAHELRNPLASLKGNAQLLVEQLEGRPRSRAERVVGEAERMERLITDLLEFVRAGRLDRQTVDVGEVLERAAQSVARDQVEVVSPAQLSWSLDPGRIHQALTNLLDNAVKVSPAGVKVELTAEQRRGELVLTVRDRGPGVPEADMEKIFEPFFTTRTQGVGLGLMVVKTVTERHGGHIKVGRPPGGGALFTMTLPAV